MDSILQDNIATQDWKPVLSRDIKLTENEGMLILNQQKLGYQLKLDAKARQFLQLMDGSCNLEALTHWYNTIYEKQIAATELKQFLQNEFVNKGFIESDQLVKKRATATYLKLRISIIPSALLNKLNTTGTAFIYKPLFFYCSLLTFFLINLIVFLLYKNSVYQSTSWQVLSILFVSHIFHELGHALAAKSKLATPGNIGFGFYFILPVFFVDLSDVWNLKKKERIIINLSGIYFDYLLGCIFFLLFLATGNNLFIVVNLLLFLKTFYNINPLIRSDAYWILSDMLEKPNLNENANLAFRNFFSFKWATQKSPTRIGKNALIALYGALTYAFWIYIIIGIIKQSRTGFNGFVSLYNELKTSLKTNSWNFSSLMGKLISLLLMAIAFLIVFKMVTNWIKSIVKRWKKR